LDCPLLTTVSYFFSCGTLPIRSAPKTWTQVGNKSGNKLAEAGLETVSNSPRKTANDEVGGAKSGALGTGTSPQLAQPMPPNDTDLARLIARWPFLAVGVRAAIIAILDGSCKDEPPTV